MLHWVSGYLQETSLKLPYLMSSAFKYCVSSIHITRDQEQFHSCRSQFIPLQMIRCSRVWIPEKGKCQHLNIKQHHSGLASTINPLYPSNSRSASFCSFTPPFFLAEIRDKGIMGPVPPFHSKNKHPFPTASDPPSQGLGGSQHHARGSILEDQVLKPNEVRSSQQQVDRYENFVPFIPQSMKLAGPVISFFFFLHVVYENLKCCYWPLLYTQAVSNFLSVHCVIPFFLKKLLATCLFVPKIKIQGAVQVSRYNNPLEWTLYMKWPSHRPLEIFLFLFVLLANFLCIFSVLLRRIYFQSLAEIVIREILKPQVLINSLAKLKWRSP